MILAVDGGLATCGYAIVTWSGRIDALGVLTSKPDPKLGVTADRAARTTRLARELAAAMRNAPQQIEAIVAERMSFPPKAGHHATASICLGWGVLTGLATASGLEVVDVAPKTWQRAVVPAAVDERDQDAIDYDVVFAELARYVAESPAAGQLAAIPKSRQSHCLDAVGVGVYAAMLGMSFGDAGDRPATVSTRRPRRRAVERHEAERST
ncbi:MAG: Crossover junction endodeoxyribonuclease RuvC [Acidimicrobiaceae bacterium]|nr:Crossover junction endodeoxyribonuclease RuvC [Acidimicrobiaceae bacterium]